MPAIVIAPQSSPRTMDSLLSPSEAFRVISGTFRAWIGRRLACALILVPTVLSVTGCDPDPYPSTMIYSPRTDLLVLEAKDRDIPRTFGPGQLEAHFKLLREKAKEEPAKFKVADPADLPGDKRAKIDEELEKRFGTPAAPRVVVTDDPTLVKELAIDEDTLAKGSILYRRHCLHCHGVSGDGRGSTAPWVNPPPRDYRRNAFKFTSHYRGLANAARRSDIIRTLNEGIEGTSMPTFKAQPPRDLEALASYVIHLAVRGAVQFDAISEVLTKPTSGDANDLPKMIEERTNLYTFVWKDVTVIEPHPYPAEFGEFSPTTKADEEKLHASVREGYKLFLGKGACITCHTDFGRQAQFIYDKWGTLVRPNNLTQAIYRGGRRPLDIYYRINSGIDPSTMPGATVEVAKDPKAMWSLVNFVRLLPYPSMLPDDVRMKVYGPAR